ncbi:hypothetical protein AVDCRST_MAG92-2537, partial [uncultured Coleofasciculus sp.]
PLSLAQEQERLLGIFTMQINGMTWTKHSKNQTYC